MTFTFQKYDGSAHKVLGLLNRAYGNVQQVRTGNLQFLRNAKVLSQLSNEIPAGAILFCICIVLADTLNYLLGGFAKNFATERDRFYCKSEIADKMPARAHNIRDRLFLFRKKNRILL